MAERSKVSYKLETAKYMPPTNMYENRKNSAKEKQNLNDVDYFQKSYKFYR